MTIAKVRRLTGDTDATDYRLSDDDITEILSDNNSNVYAAAAEAARAIAAQMALYEDIKISESSMTSNNAYQAMLSLADKLEVVAARSKALPFAGGISKASKTAREADTDRVEPAFTRTLHDNVGSI